MNREMTGAEMVVQALKDQGVDTVFGYPGGAVLPIYDAIFQQNDIRHILVRHEQAAAHAAEGYARSTGKPGVVLVTSGPGATNAVTGMTDALMDSIPMVVLTGQVPTFLIGNDAFQEADTVGITRPCTKHNWLVKDTAKLAETIHQAFHVATHGRPGPVLVDIPKDVQFATAAYVAPEAARVSHYQPRTRGDADAILAAVEALEKAERPVIYSGGGVINSGREASRLLRELADTAGFPITSTLMGLGAYPASGKRWIGMLGMHGTYEANWAMHDCDVMLCIGARFDDRITGRTDAFSPGSFKIHVDIDPSSINKNIHVHVPIVGDVAAVLADMLALWKERGSKTASVAVGKWWKQIELWRGRNCLAYRNSDKVIKPQYALQRLEALTRHYDRYICTEVGQHQMWAAQYMGFDEPHRWMTSGGLGTMGYGHPASIGVQIAHPGRAGHQRRRRGVVADEHAGDGDRGAVPPAGQAVHPQQRAAGHGAAVAGAAARRALLVELVRGAAGLREARRGVRGQGHPDHRSGEARRRHRRDAGAPRPGDRRLRRREARELLPDDPERQGAQRDAARRGRRLRRHRRRRRGPGLTMAGR